MAASVNIYCFHFVEWATKSPAMRLLKDSAVPTLFSYCAGKQPRKRKGIAGRQEKAAKKTQVR